MSPPHDAGIGASDLFGNVDWSDKEIFGRQGGLVT